MRPRFLWLAALLLLAGCVPPVRDFGPEPATTPTWIVSFDDVLTAKLPDIEPLAQVKKQAFSGEINLAKPLAAMHAAWRAYLDQLHDARLESYPSLIKGVEMEEGGDFGEVCNPGPNHRYPELIQPTYCADRKLGDAVPAYIVLPPGFTAQVEAFAQEAGEQAGWVLASLVVARVYATHLRHDLATVQVMWPDGAPFDYCVTGMSLRSVFPRGYTALDDTGMEAVMAKLGELTHATDGTAEFAHQILSGYANGRLEECVV